MNNYSKNVNMYFMLMIIAHMCLSHVSFSLALHLVRSSWPMRDDVHVNQDIDNLVCEVCVLV